MKKFDPQLHSRSVLSASRIADCASLMRECRLCAWDCGVDRTAGPAGRCHAAAKGRVFQQRIEWVGERDIVPTRLVNFSGCNFRCNFCLTGNNSQDARRGNFLDPLAFGASLQSDRGCYRTVTIEGGEASIFLADAMAAIAQVPEDVPVVWKTNAYSSEVALSKLKGCIDVFLADYKFGNESCARRLSGTQDYLRHLHANLVWAHRHTRLIVRHLLMPGHVECCLGPALEWLAREMPGVDLSIMNSFTPAWNSRRTPELLNPSSEAELKRARDLICQSGLKILPWHVADTPADYQSETEAVADQISIGPDGSIRVAFMTANLKAALQGLQHEFPMVVNL